MTTAAISPFHEAARLRSEQEKAPRSLYSKGTEGLSVGIDCLSLTRNGLSAGGVIAGAETAAKVAPAVGGMVVAGGALAFLGGAALMKNGCAGAMRAYELGNWEGGVSSGMLAAAGASYSVAGGGMIAAQSGVYASSAAVAATGATVLTGAAFGLYGAVAAYAGYGLGINATFRRNLNRRLEGVAAEEVRLAAALEWLQSEVRKGQTPKELEKCWDQFASRTSAACCRFVREHVTPELIDQVKSGDAKAKLHANWIIQEVKRENNKQMAKHCLLLAIAAIGIAAMICGLVFATGPFAPLLMAVGAALWLLFDSAALQKKFGDAVCGKSEIT